MARRRKSRGRRRRRPGINSDIYLAYPQIITVEEKKSKELTFNDFFPTGGFFTNWPWRLIGIRVQAACFNGASTPAIVQVALDVGMSVNVEHVQIKRWMVGPVPTSRYLKSRAPNPWREEEQKTQSIIEVINLNEASSATNTCTFYIEAEFQFNKAAYMKLASLQFSATAFHRSLAFQGQQPVPQSAPSSEFGSLNLEDY